MSNSPQVSIIAVTGFILALVAGLGAILAGWGSRLGWWSFRVGFAILGGAAFLGATAAVVSLVGTILARPSRGRGGLGLAVVGLLVGLSVAGVLWQWRETAQRVPAIHDITTDPDNPPGFVAILPLRKDAPNPAAYGGPDIAAQQRAAYPEVVPAKLDLPPAEAFKRALAAARRMRWDIVDADEAQGRIEATDTTFWFGFKDDIVVRVTPMPGGQGSRIDVRSVSRVGRSDIGANARRIKAYLKELAAPAA